MQKVKDLNLKTKFTLLFVLIGLLPIIVVSYISTQNSTIDAQEKVYNQLTAINQIKKKTIETYFHERESDMGVLVNIADTLRIQAFQKLSAVQDLKKSELTHYLHDNYSQLKLLTSQEHVKHALEEMSATFNNQAIWTPLLDVHDTEFKQLLDYFGWYDFFLINLEGDIVYSVTRESDLRQNLEEELSSSSFYQAFKKAKNSQDNDIHLADFLPYGPSNNDPAAFAVKAVVKEGKRIGYIAYQQPLEHINEILGHRTGMGETGESYLVGQDLLMRSDSFLNPSEFSVKASFKHQNKVETKAALDALDGGKNTAVILDYNNNPVISSWDYVDVGERIRWAIISEVDVTEAFNPKTSDGIDFYKSYIEKYGYYDLFLINPDGYIFYTVTKEADYHTNIINGKYADSGLGKLIRSVSQSKAYSMADFSPYSPSNDDPATFIAQPLLNKTGEISLYLALQLPLEGIENIMKIREGMGETGESYLVGEDLRMRSNSFLDPEGHSVKNSFAGTIAENGVDTDASRRALNGEKGTDIIIDYNGHPVLSSFDHIDFKNFKWAILSEVDEEEAFHSIHTNTLFMLVIMLIAGTLIATVGFLAASRIAKPISNISDVAKLIANGDLTSLVEAKSNDEVGKLQQAMKQMIENLRNMVVNIASVAKEESVTSEQLVSITSKTTNIVKEQQDIAENFSSSMSQMGATVTEVAENTSNTSVAVNEIQSKVMEGASALDKTYHSILSMTEQIQQSEKSVQQVRSDFDQICSVLDVIKDIAEQTNLLALNAAIEAARAGEQGRGFAVVADEVRQLAQRTQDSTKQIDDMIQNIIAGANSSVDIMAKSVSRATEVQEHAKKATDINVVITDQISHISTLSSQIATSTKEQSQMIEGILSNVENLNEGVHRTNSATHDIADSSSKLSNLVNKLEHETKFFKV
ncbi:hypothetical protein MED121_20481 [Marinomonas sp. MED121]|uniref:methyl-accepting chemotaxis protein n=1 Tax=Marinomonas sp. MED121 TaxID=314277 RepID=UPI0000690A13|nr:methyl-accepting chemotaxis protein [Marinomonas sp. MED121]EAQ63984.1 hypothetical protein MED121_20481 [Marinomonas sp. MED121]